MSEQNYGPCVNCGAGPTAHLWKLPKVCGNYVSACESALPKPEARRQARIDCGGNRPCQEWNCDYCHPETKPEVAQEKGALCDPYYVGRSPDVATTQRDEEPCHCGEHACVGTDRITHPFFCKRMRESKPAPQAELDEAWRRYRTLSKGDFDNHARMHFASGYLAAQAPLLQRIVDLENRLSKRAPIYSASIDKIPSLSVEDNEICDPGEVSSDELVAMWGKLKEYAEKADARIAEPESAQPKAEKVEKLVSDMPKLVEEAWQHEEKMALSADRYSRADYACQHLGHLIVERLHQHGKRRDSEQIGDV